MNLMGSGPVTLNGVGRPGVKKGLDDGYEYERSPVRPDPSPRLGDAIRRLHRWCVRAAARRLGTTDPAVIGEALYLHPAIVAARLRELGHAAVAPGAPDPDAPPKRATRAATVARMAALILDRGPQTAAQLGEAVGRHQNQIMQYLRTTPATFAVAWTTTHPANGNKVAAWKLAGDTHTTTGRRGG